VSHSPATDSRPQVDVLALIDHFAVGGAETLLTRFAEVAPRAGIRLSIACLEERDGNPAAEPLRARGVPPHDLGVRGRPGLRDLGKVRHYIASVKPQIVHTHLGTSDIVGGITARSLGVPMITTIHAMDWRRGNRAYDAKRMLVRLCAARVIAVSDSARRSYLERGWARERQIVTIHNGIDVIPEPGSGAAVRAELGIEPDAFVVGMVSALRPEKAHDVAIDAVSLLRDRFPRLRLLIAGQGASGDEIAARAAKLGGAAVMAGSRADVMRVFDAADLCLHPSRADAFPTTLIEAMAASVPVLATAVGGIPEIITDGRTGVLMPAPPSPQAVAAQLAALIDDSGTRASLAANARRDYELRFTADPWVRRTRELYDEVLAGRRSRLRHRVEPTTNLVGARVSGD
jgi:glycosyltransferase involved in cell wall biosynthesis